MYVRTYEAVSLALPIYRCIGAASCVHVDVLQYSCAMHVMRLSLCMQQSLYGCVFVLSSACTCMCVSGRLERDITCLIDRERSSVEAKESDCKHRLPCFSKNRIVALRRTSWMQKVFMPAEARPRNEPPTQHESSERSSTDDASLLFLLGGSDGRAER